MASLTKVKINNIDTSITYVYDPLVLMNFGSTLANTDVGFVFNRDGGISSNVAVYWNESTDRITIGYTSASGLPNSNISLTKYANVAADWYFGNLAGGTTNTVWISANVLPTANAFYNFGSPTQRWNVGYFAATTLDLGGSQISVDPVNGFKFTVGGSNTPTYLSSNGLVSGSSLSTSGTVLADGDINTKANVLASQVSAGSVVTTGVINTGGNILARTAIFNYLDVNGNIVVGDVGTPGAGHSIIGNIVQSGAGTVWFNTPGNLLAALGQFGQVRSDGLINTSANIMAATGRFGTVLSDGFINTSANISAATYIGGQVVVSTMLNTAGNVLTKELDVFGNAQIGALSTAGVVHDIIGNVRQSGAGTVFFNTPGNIMAALGQFGAVNVSGYINGAGNISTPQLNAGQINTTGNVLAQIGIFNELDLNGYLNSTGNILATSGVFNALTVNGGITSTGFINTTANISASIARAGTITTTGTLTAAIVNSTGNILATAGTFNALTVNGGVTSSGFINTTANISAAIGQFGAINSTGYINTTGNISTAQLNAGQINTTGNILATGAVFNSERVNGTSTVNVLNSTGNILGTGGIFNSLTVNGNQSVTGYLNVTGNVIATVAEVGAIESSGVIYANSTAAGTSSTSGALIVAGGIGVAKDSHFAGNLTIDGNLFINGNATTLNTNNLSISDSLIYLATTNPADSLDIGFIGHFINPGYQHTGVARDATDGVWKLFANVVPEPTTTIDFTNATYSNLLIGNLLAGQATITGLNSAGFINTSGNVSAATVLAGAVTSTGYINTSGNISTAQLNAGQINTTGNVLAQGAVFNSERVNGTSTVNVLNSTGNILGTGGVFNSLTVNGGITSTGFFNTSGNVSAATILAGAINSTGFINTTGNISAATVRAGQINTTGNVLALNVLSNFITADDAVIGNISASVFGNTGAVFTGATLTTTSYANIGGPALFSSNVNVPTIQVNGTATKGGTGYHDFLSATNLGGGTNPNKYFRLDSEGTFQIINSAYTANPFSLTDDGRVYISGNINAGSLTIPGAQHVLNGNVQINAIGSIQVPVGDTLQRPGSGIAGQIRFNTDTNQFEGYSNVWGAISGGGGGGGTPGGVTSTLQYNNGGAFGGIATMNYILANGAIIISSGTSSTSTGTGALQIIGGLGITENINTGGSITTTGLINTSANISASQVSAGSVVTTGVVNAGGNVLAKVGIFNELDVNGNIVVGLISTPGAGHSFVGNIVQSGAGTVYFNTPGNIMAAQGSFGTINATGFINTTANISASTVIAGAITTTGTSTAATVNATGNVLAQIGIFNEIDLNGYLNSTGNVLATGGVFNALRINGVINSTGNILSTGAIHNSLSVNGTTTITDTAGAASATKVLSVVNGTYSVGIGARMGAGSYNPMVTSDDTVINFTSGTQGQGDLAIVPWSVHAGGGIVISSTANTVTVGGSIIPYSSNAYTLGSTTAWWSKAFTKSAVAQYADLAENYTSDFEYAPGTVLVFGGEFEVTQSTQSHDTAIAGVVSTNPAYHMNALTVGVAVALQGRVPCQVRGPVRKGDRVVASDIPGVAQKLVMSDYQPGCIIGKSLENIDDDSIQTIEVVVGRL